jgi:5-methylcytosine-specific restriction enzyme subunit McrC
MAANPEGPSTQQRVATERQITERQTTERQTFVLTEYAPCLLPQPALSAEEGVHLWQRYGNYVSVDFPSPKTQDQWQLTAQGWVGYLPLSARVGLSLQPRAPLANLFRMIEVVYALAPLDLSDDLFHCASLVEFYERLALLLAQRIQDRCRTGLFRSYQARQADLPYVRGTLDLARVLTSPGQATAPCRFEEQTFDVAENQILAWTIWSILRSNFCSEQSLPLLRQVYRLLAGSVSLQPLDPLACVNRTYNRLNADYRPLHALCRFFLEQSGPSHLTGDREMSAFLVDMGQLYERFVAAWLAARAPECYSVQIQERMHFGVDRGYGFIIDMVIYDRQSGDPLAVLDTKYKAPATSPAGADIAQVVAYATAKGCKEALLVYPVRLAQPFDAWVGDVRVRSLSFELDGDLEAAGQSFLNGWGSIRSNVAPVNRICSKTEC